MQVKLRDAEFRQSLAMGAVVVAALALLIVLLAKGIK